MLPSAVGTESHRQSMGHWFESQYIIFMFGHGNISLTVVSSVEKMGSKVCQTGWFDQNEH